MPVHVDRLEPGPAPSSVAAALAGLDPSRRAGLARPYVYVSAVASVDGRAAVRGSSRGLGDEADLACLLELRTLADAVLVGTGTVRAEGYGRLVRAPERRARREAAGRPADPPAVVVARSGDVPWEAALFTAAEQPVLVYAGGAGAVRPPAWVAAPVEVVAAHAVGSGLPGILADLRTRGIRALLCEGGPTLTRALLDLGLVDELFLTLAPALVGDEAAPTLVAGGPLAAAARLELRWVLRHGDELLLRYGVGA